MKKKSNLLIILLVSIALSHCAFSGNNSWDSQVRGSEEMPDKYPTPGAETRHKK